MARYLPLLLFLVPAASVWAAYHERLILRAGTPLDDAALADAVAMGVSHPRRIRILQVEKIPFLNGRFLRALSKFNSQISIHTVGVCFRYGIYLRNGYDPLKLRQLIAHECVHTAQYERCGGIMNFMKRYFSECLTTGYHGAPLEREAITKARQVCEDGGPEDQARLV